MKSFGGFYRQTSIAFEEGVPMSSPQQQSVGPREILFAIIAIIGVVILLGWLSAPRTVPPVAAAAPAAQTPPGSGLSRELDDPAKASVHADELARKSGGDLSKLSEMDQRWLDASTAGHAQEFLTERQKALSKHGHAAKEKPLPKTP
ncbi:MAG: hypothetical protein JWL77_6180 [Chthonomonadaceae bacterium]|nr:hypothetical protein [Chthonomonadaceae bacterium]